MDLFTLKRLAKFVAEHRLSSGQLATYQDLEKAGFSKEEIQSAKKKKLIEEFFVTLTNGTIMKGFKATQ